MHPDDDVTRSAPAATPAGMPSAAGALIRAGTMLGPYRVLHEIGRGGMGAVYLAVRSDDAFRKRVAVKVLKRGMDSDAIVGRFRHERQILAGLEHPYIAGLIDGGTTENGLPYFVLEYVEGEPIDSYCDGRRLDTTARLELFRKVCAAVQYAHQNLIVHRDLKPANVLVTADGTPKLLDFGIAKLLDPEFPSAAAATVAGPQMMTPEYASPEQVRGEPVSTASDVYSLGVMLYELLTGCRPYRITSRTPAEIARVVCDSEPVRPSTAVTSSAREVVADAAGGADVPSRTAAPSSTDGARLRRRLAGDLDNIILKALSKEPARRYASVDLFSEDLRRHMAGLPVTARKDTLGYRTSKFVARNRPAVIASALVLVALIAGIVGTSWQARAARRERLRAEQRFDQVRELANASLFELHDAIRDLPGSTKARQLLVSRGLGYLDKLAADAGDRPDLRRELAAGYVRVGDVQGRPFNPNLGDTAGALESYRKSVAIYESIGAADSSDAGLRRELATALVRLSEALAATSDTAGALSAAQRALTLQQSAATGGAGDGAVPAELRRELAASYSRVGDLLSATGDTRGALEQRRLALGLMETLAASDPDDPSNLRQLGVAYQKLGNSLGNPNYPNVGDTAGALVQLERAADVYRRATTLHRANAMFRRNAAVIDSNIADVLLALGRSDEALARQRRALTAFEALAAADPTNEAANNDVAISRSKIGEMLDAGGQSAEAVAEYRHALAIHQRMAKGDPGNDSLRLELASDYNRLATAQAKLGDREVSLANHTRAVEIARELLAANPANVELKVAVALALAGRADAAEGFARRGLDRDTGLARAERDYAEAVELLEALAKIHAIEGTDLRTLEQTRQSLAQVRKRLRLAAPASQ